MLNALSVHVFTAILKSEFFIALVFMLIAVIANKIYGFFLKFVASG